MSKETDDENKSEQQADLINLVGVWGVRIILIAGMIGLYALDKKEAAAMVSMAVILSFLFL